MTNRDEHILRSSSSVFESALELANTTAEIARSKRRQRTLIRKLLRAGLTARYVGKLSNMSHQTVLRIRDEP